MLERWKSYWSRLLGGPRRTAREEKVLEYIAHRVDGGARPQEVARDEYVRRMATEEELRRMLSDPRIVGGARGRMHQDLDPGDPALRRSAPDGDSLRGTPKTGGGPFKTGEAARGSRDRA